MFKPQLININNDAFKNDNHKAKLELKTFKLVLAEVEKLIELPTDNKEFLELIKNPMGYVELYFKRSYASKIDIPISNKKLLELLEIDLNPLIKALTRYTNTTITSIDCQAVSRVKKENYETYTTNQAQNTRLKEFNDLITAFCKITNNTFTNGYLHELNRMFDSKCYYENGKLIPTVKYIKEV